MFERSGETIV